MKRNVLFYAWLALSFIEVIILGISSLSNVITLGANVFSSPNFIVWVFFFLIFIFLILALRSEVKIHRFLAVNFDTEKSNRPMVALGIISFYLLYLTLFTPTVYLKEFEAIFIVIRPILLWLELFLIQTVVWIKLVKKSFNLSSIKSPIDKKTYFLVFIPLLLIWLTISITKVGLVKDTAFWNVPGIPLNVIQFLSLLLFLVLGLIFASQACDRPDKVSKALSILIPIGIYLAAVLMWGLTPMLKHFFSLQPTLPNLQPFPYSDARIHDLGALSILWGKGVYFYGYTDKPLYMLFLAVLHLFSNSDYNLLQWAQISVLSLAPVILYKFGKKAFGSVFGIIIAMMLVFQQSNAITLSYKVASVNPKLLVSEELTLLGIILIVYLIFNWMKSPEAKKIFLLGGLVGAFSLVRINPIFILLFIALSIIFKYRKNSKQIFKQLALLVVGFSLVFSPWLFTGVDAGGRSWFFLKIQDVINVRYKTQNDPIPLNQPRIQYVSISPQVSSTRHGMSFPGIFSQSITASLPMDLQKKTEPVSWIMLNHFLHNISASLLALPDSIKVYNINDVIAREYWQDVNQWQGNFPTTQYMRILVNILILSIGIAFSWKSQRWSGLIPLIVFVVYNVSLSAATNSGSRYIVPINWIFFFYYALGLMVIGRYLLSLLGVRPRYGIPESSIERVATKKTQLRSWIPSVAVIVVLAVSLPTVNLILPKLVHTGLNATQLSDYVKAREKGDSELISGLLLYPYYQDNGLLAFDFLVGSELSSYSVSQEHLIAPDIVVPESGTPALLSVTYNNNEAEIRTIYIVDGNTPQIFWQLD